MLQLPDSAEVLTGSNSSLNRELQNDEHHDLQSEEGMDYATPENKPWEKEDLR